MLMGNLLRLTFLIFASTQLLHAQTYTLRGTVTDSDQKPIEGAVVSVVNGADSVFVKAALTEPNGAFLVALAKPGRYRAVVSFLGYQSAKSQTIALDPQQTALTLPPFVLKPSQKNLTEVRVVAQKPFVEQHIDRVVINPDALISNAGATSLEVLEKSPGVQVDVNGTISLRGRAGVVVFVDDKPTYLAAADLANYLRSLPAGSVETIELMTNPPAKYDAAGNAGVINIRLKKTSTRGFNGGLNLSYGQGRYIRSNNSANLNYRISKLNFFGNASLNSNNNFQDLTIWRHYFTPTGERSSAFTQNSYFKRKLNSANLKAGVDWYASKKTTLGLVLTGFRNVGNTSITNNANVFDAHNAVSSQVKALSLADKVLMNGSINGNFTHNFDPATRVGGSRELSANVDYLTYSSDLNQSLTNTVFGSGKSVSQSILESALPATITIQTAKTDYIHPLKTGGKFETGLKISQIKTNNVADFFDVLNNERLPNYQFSNNFTYHERINAGYVNYNVERGRLSVQTGLRVENTGVRGEQLGNKQVKDSSFTRQYTSLFPTFYTTYRLDSAGKHQLGFSYGRRIDRPNYADLNPFTYPIDRFTLYGGNPFLRPTFSDNLELSYTLNNAITTTLRYSKGSDDIIETIEQRGTIFYSRPGNLGQFVSYGVGINGTYQPAKWWTIQFYTELTHNNFRSLLYNQQLNNSGTYWHVAPTNQFKFSPVWSAELGGTYQTRTYVGQFVLIPVGSMRVALARKIWHDKGTLKAALSDLFYTQQPGGDIRSLANSTANWYSYLDSRVATVSFSYRFNKGKAGPTRQTGGAENEQKRVKS